MADGYGPEERSRVLREIEAEDCRLAWERSAIPARTGNLAADLAAAQEAVDKVTSAWEDAAAAARSAGPYPEPSEYRAEVAARTRADELWRLRERAVAVRDALEAEETQLRDGSELRPGSWETPRGVPDPQ